MESIAVHVIQLTDTVHWTAGTRGTVCLRSATGTAGSSTRRIPTETRQNELCIGETNIGGLQHVTYRHCDIDIVCKLIHSLLHSFPTTPNRS